MKLRLNLRRKAIVIAAGLGIGLGATGVALAYPGYATGNVNVRVGPSTSYPKIASIAPGTPLDIRFCQPSWCQVGFWGGVGWVSARYVGAAAPGPGFGQPGFFFRFGTPPPRRWHPPTYSPWPLPPPWRW